MNKWLLSLALLLVGVPTRAQQAVIGASCPASGQSAISTTGVPVQCTQIPSGGALVWTAVGGAGGGISSVASLPATCTPGVTADVRLTTPPFGNFYCSYINQWAPYSNTQNTLTPTAFGAKGDVVAIFDATFSNTLTTITSAGQAHWCNGTTVACTGAETPDVGKVVFGTGCGPVTAMYLGTLQVPQGTITTVNSATSISVSLAATATNSGAGCLLWGTDDTPAFDALTTAMVNASDCQSVYIPSRYFVTKGYFNQETNNCTIGFAQNAIDYSMHIYGNGPGVSTLIPLPNLNFSTACTVTPGGATNPSCFFGALSVTVRDLGIWGGGFGNTASAVNRNLIGTSPGSQYFNVACAGWGGNDIRLIGLNMNSSRFTQFSEDGCGQTGAQVQNSTSPVNKSVVQWGFFGDNGNINLTIPSSQLLDCYTCQYGAAAGSVSVQVNTAAIYNDFGGQLFSVNNATTAGLECSGAGTACNFYGSSWKDANVAGSSGLWLHNGATVNAENSVFSGGATNGCIIRQDTAAFYDHGGNSCLTNDSTSIRPTCAATTGGTACSLLAGSRNEGGTIHMTASAVATGTITLTFAGTFTGPGALLPNCNFDYANTGSGAWSLTTTTPVILITRSTTAPVLNWNQTAALTAASTYDIDYVCRPKFQ